MRIQVPCNPGWSLVRSYAHCAHINDVTKLEGHVAVEHASSRAPLESVSLCTRFSSFSTIFSFGFNRLSSWKLVGLFFNLLFRIVILLVPKDFVQDCFVAQIYAKMCVGAGICAYLGDFNQIYTQASTTLGSNSKNHPCIPKLQRCSPHQHPRLSSSGRGCLCTGSSAGNEGSL